MLHAKLFFRRITFFVLAPVAFALSTLVIALLIIQSYSYKTLDTQLLHVVAESVQRTIHDNPGASTQQMQHLLMPLLNIESVRHLSIYSQGELHNIGMPISDITEFSPKESTSIQIVKKNIHFLITPLNQTTHPSWLILGIQTFQIELSQYKVYFILLLVCVITLAMALFFIDRLKETITRPLTQLIQDVKETVANPDKTLKPSRNPIYEELVRAINRIINQHQILQNEMQVHVDQATRELRETLETVEVQNMELDIARKSALQSSRAKSEFLANTSHELRTPLTAILGFTSLLANTKGSPQQVDYINNIDKSAQNLLTLINDILDFSKLDTGQLALETKPLDVRQLAHETLALHQDQATEHHLQWELNVDPSIPSNILGDPQRIKQILSNLISNAVKFSNHNRVILNLINLGILDHHIEIKFSIVDFGIGLTNEQKQEVFAPFTKTDNRNNRRQSGTGLGLAISKGLIEQMHGTLGVESTPKKGSTFWFTCKFGIELSANSSTSILENTTDTTQPTVSAHILIVDDNHSNLKLVSEFLKHLKCTTKTASSGQEAIALNDANTFDLILMDVQMPDMDGLETTREIRKRETGKRTPILALTAHAIQDQRTQLLMAGMDDFLSKPVSENDLKYVIERWVKSCPTKGIESMSLDVGRSLAAFNARQSIAQEENLQTLAKFDRTEALELANRNPQLAKDMMKMLLDSLPATELQIQSRHAQHDEAELIEIIHKFKGGTCYCGVPALRQACLNLESSLLKKDSLLAQQYLIRLLEEMAALQNWSQNFDLDAMFELD